MPFLYPYVDRSGLHRLEGLPEDEGIRASEPACDWAYRSGCMVCRQEGDVG